MLVVVALRNCCFEVARVNDNALAPVLVSGDLVLINKLAYGLRIPGAGDYLWLHRPPKFGDLVFAVEWGDPPITVLRYITAMPSDDQIAMAGYSGAGVTYGLGIQRREVKAGSDLGPARLRNFGGEARYILLPRENKVNSWWGRFIRPIL